MSDCEGPACNIPKYDRTPQGYNHLRGQMLRDATTWKEAKGTAIESEVLEEWNRMYGGAPE